MKYLREEYALHRDELFPLKLEKQIYKILYDKTGDYKSMYEKKVEDICEKLNISLGTARKCKRIVRKYIINHIPKGFVDLPHDDGYMIHMDTFAIINKLNGKLVAKYLGHAGYPMVFLNLKHSRFVHRLVAQTFIPNDDETLIAVNHIDGNKLNYSITNLEWVTIQENNVHAIETGLRKIHGEDNGRAVLTLVQVKEIRKSELPSKELAEMYGVSVNTIRNIRNNKTWKTIGE